MKKLYAILLIMLIGCGASFAGTTFLKYNSAGKPINDNNFGSNAITSPRTNKQLIQKNRERKLEDAYYKQFENMNKHEININTNNTNEDNKTEDSAINNSSSTENTKPETKTETETKSETKSAPKTINGVTYYE